MFFASIILSCFLRAGLIIDLSGMKQSLITFLSCACHRVWCGYQKLFLKTSRLAFSVMF